MFGENIHSFILGNFYFFLGGVSPLSPPGFLAISHILFLTTSNLLSSVVNLFVKDQRKIPSIGMNRFSSYVGSISTIIESIMATPSCF